ncbi:MAG: hypothetical protein BGP01_11145 [Paludibacter sp. 47-17]|jgi:hypothetical protein|nr:MAG: hypothetical protein ABS72_00135 [Paludibacter sp. SCN 50-10]OJX90950.1 MAG: hypothetical protein BGP01_11145 [Paludibacter sp. 47-17]
MSWKPDWADDAGCGSGACRMRGDGRSSSQEMFREFDPIDKNNNFFRILAKKINNDPIFNAFFSGF